LTVGKVEVEIKKPHRQLVLIKGAGDLATGVGHRLYRAGFKVVMTEQERSSVIRRPVSFARAVFEKEAVVEGVRALKVTGFVSGSEEPGGNQKEKEVVNYIFSLLDRGLVPVVVDPNLQIIPYLKLGVFVEGTLSKKNTGVSPDLAPLVIALGPGYHAGRDVHAVVETRRGHDLGRVIYSGKAIPNDGLPGSVSGYSTERLLRAPGAGRFKGEVKIGDLVKAGQVVGFTGNEAVKAEIGGIVRGLIQDGLEVRPGMKIGDIDPRGKREYCFTISDKARSVGGGVLEAILALEAERVRPGRKRG